jgi:hypothetical protein
MDSLPPTSEEAIRHEMEEIRPGRSKPCNLRDQIYNQFLPTLRASDHTRSQPYPAEFKRENPSLAAHIALLLPTPTGSPPNFKNIEIADKTGNQNPTANERWYNKKTGRHVQKGIEQVLNALFPTPTAQDMKNSSFPPGLTTWNRMGTKSLCQTLSESGAVGRLNPVFLELMMGYPKGWTDLNT